MTEKVFVKPREVGEKVPLEPGARDAGRRHLLAEGEWRADHLHWHRMHRDGSALLGKAESEVTAAAAKLEAEHKAARERVAAALKSVADEAGAKESKAKSAASEAPARAAKGE